MPYLFAHGLGQSPAAWSETLWRMPGLYAADAHCPDLVRLLSGKPADYNALYRAFSEYCAALPQPLHLCGLSLGGVLALQYAAEHPTRAASLVLIGAQYRMPGKLLAVQSAVFRLMPERAFRQMGFAKQDVLRLTGSMRELDFSDALSAIPCPALILCGGKDRANRAAAQELTARLPDARLQTIAGAGHEVNVDTPAQLALALTRFWHAKN